MKNQCMYYVSIFWILPLNFQLNFLILKIGSSKIRNLKIKSVVLYPVIIHNLVLLSTEYQSNIDNCLRSPLFILSGHKKTHFLNQSSLNNSFQLKVLTYLWNMQEVFEIDFNQYCLPIQYVYYLRKHMYLSHLWKTKVILFQRLN